MIRIIIKITAVTLALFISTAFSAGLSEPVKDNPEQSNRVWRTLIGQFYPLPDQIVLGMPALSRLIPGRLRIIADPRYTANFRHELFGSGILVFPFAFDPVKPELILPVAEVRPAPDSLPWPRRELDLGGLTYEWNGSLKTLEEYVVTTETDCLIIIHDGCIIYEQYANGWLSHMPHQPWSVTKSITSALVGIAWGEGKIESLQDPIEKYIPELAGTDYAGASIENLLQMESGLFWDEERPFLPANCQVREWLTLFADYLSGGRIGLARNRFLKTLQRVDEPGTVFRYNSGDTQVLAWLLEDLYRSDYACILSAKIWQPAGMEQSAFVMTDREGRAIASQGLYATALDLARFGELYRNHGRTADGHQVIPAEWVSRSVAFTEASEGTYGYQWWFPGEPPGSFQASGFQGNKVAVSPEAGLTAVRLSHQLGIDFLPYRNDPDRQNRVGFAVYMGSEEWVAVLNAVHRELISFVGP